MSKTTDHAIHEANQIKDGFHYYHTAKKHLSKFERAYDGKARLEHLVNALGSLVEAHKLIAEQHSKPIYGGGAVNPCPCQPEHNPSLDPDRV